MPAALVLCSSALLLAGCLSRPALVRESFALNTPTVKTPAAAPRAGAATIRCVRVSPLFDSESFVYRTGEHSYERDPYAQFLVPPENALGVPVRDALRASGLFGDVVETGSALRPDLWIEVHVPELYGDFSRRDQAAAVLSVRFVLVPANKPGAGQALFEKAYTRRVALRERTASALVAGWDEALAQIVNEFFADLGKSALPSAAQTAQ